MKSRMKKHKISVILIVIFGIILLFAACNLFYNKIASKEIKNLNTTDQKVVSQLEQMYKADADNEIWEDFSMRDRSLFLVNSDNIVITLFGYAYAVNCDGLDGKIYAQKIELDDDSSIKSLYRISPLYFSAIKARLPGDNFSTVGSNMKVGDSDHVYYIKYNEKDNLERDTPTAQFGIFLAHESFHYYMQSQWKLGELNSIDNLSEQQYNLMEQEFEVLGKMQTETLKVSSNKETLKELSKEYVAIMDKRIDNDSKYVEGELLEETAEGTATYVGIKSAKAIGYDFGVMYFDNTKNVSFHQVFPAIKSGKLDKDYLSKKVLYETGSQLCMVLEKLDVPNWQEKLNSQTKENPVTLYTVLKEYCKSI